jgi:hypothetical protein
MPSSRYRELARREAELRRRFLPRVFSPTGTYSDRVHDRTRGYRLLVHAEIEAFVEDRVVEVANRAHQLWETARTARPALVALLAYDLPARDQPTSVLNRPQKPSPDLRDRVDRARNAFTTHVRTRNHGVKEHDLLNLLMPVGVQEHDLDKSWLTAIDSWAAGRGVVAHTSSGVQQQPDPKSERDSVKLLLDGLRRLDNILEGL